MKYSQEFQYKIIRTCHKITLLRRGSASESREALRNVPDDAKPIDEDEDTSGNTVLIFEIEEIVSE